MLGAIGDIFVFTRENKDDFCYLIAYKYVEQMKCTMMEKLGSKMAGKH